MKRIILNGRELTVDKDELSYDDIARMLYQPTLVCKGRSGARSVLPGDKVAVEDGMVIDCVVTGAA